MSASKTAAQTGSDRKRSTALLPPGTGIVIAYIACVLIWGTTWFAIRLCMAPGAFQPYTAGALRFTVAAAVCAVLWWAGLLRSGSGSGGLRPLDLAWLFIAGNLGAIGAALVYWAEVWISGGLASIINATAPLCMAAVAALTRAEPIRRSSVIGCTIALLGIATIFHDRFSVSAWQAFGVALILVSVVISAFNNVIVKRHAYSVHPLASAGGFSFVAALVFWSCAIGFEGGHFPWPPPALPTLAAAYLGICGSLVAFGSYFYLIKRVRLMTVTTLVFFPPLIALAVDAVFEKAVTLGPVTYAGIAITFIGVVVSLAWPKKVTAVD